MKLTYFASLYFIINSILSQSQNAEVVAQNTLILFDRLNIRARKKFAGYDEIVIAMNEPPKLHRFPNRMTSYIACSMEILTIEYSNKPENIFLDENGVLDSYNNVTNRLIRFPGIGIHKAEITYYKAAIFVNGGKCLYICPKIVACPKLFCTLSAEFEIMSKWGIGHEESVF